MGLYYFVVLHDLVTRKEEQCAIIIDFRSSLGCDKDVERGYRVRNSRGESLFGDAYLPT